MEKDGKDYSRGLITGILAGIAIILFVMLGINIVKKVNDNDTVDKGAITEIYGNDAEGKAKTIQSYIDKYYMDDVDKDKILEGMYAGMMEALDDPYSVYYTKADYKTLMESSAGQYYGIGVAVTQDPDTKAITITRVYDNSPAKTAGIQEGDQLYSVEGVEVGNRDYTDVVADIKGKEGTSIKLVVMRDGQQISMDVTRGKVDIATVDYHMLDDQIGWLYIGEFDGVTTKQVKSAIEDLQSQGMKKIIVDLRDNPGGRLDVVKDIMNIFLPKDKLLLYSVDKAGHKEEYYSDTDPILPDIPMCVLVNGNSASASEVFTGAMKCYQRATIVGTKTFGKGIMQSIFELDDGSALKITIGKYYLPDDSNIHKIGITPDQVVELPEGVTSVWTLKEDQDVQLNKAKELLK